jgi:ferric-dicitrate binding protein FerR (iron transport regulator)
MPALLSRHIHRLQRNRASVLAVAAVGLMFAMALAWLQAHAPNPGDLRAVAGAQR